MDWEKINRAQFTCHCGCGFDAVDKELHYVLMDVAHHFDRVPTINSGCRCEKHNAMVGGADKSMHLFAKAADIFVEGLYSQWEVADYLNEKYPDKYGIGRYKHFTHIDVRRTKARWGTWL